MKNRTLCWLILGMLAGSSLQAQIPNRLDSLEIFVRNYPGRDTVYARALNRMGRKLNYERADYERADSVLHLSENLSRRLNWWLGVQASLVQQGARYLLTNQPQKALLCFQKAVEVTEAHRPSKQELYDMVANVSVAYEQLEKWPEVMSNSLKAIRLQEQYGLIPRANAYQTVGQALKHMGKYNEALPYYQRALQIEQKRNEPKDLSIAHNHIGNIYDDLKQPNLALQHYRASLRLAEQVGFELLQTDGLVNIARMLQQLGKPEQGIPYAQKALTIARKQNNAEALHTAYITLGQIYQQQKNYPLAERALKQALALDQQKALPGTTPQRTSQQALADLYAEQKNFQQAYEFQALKNKQIDSAVTVRTNTEIQRLITQYQTEKKEAQIKLLRQETQLRQRETERTRLWLGVTVLLLLLASVGSAWLLNRAKLRRLQEAQDLRKRIAQDLHDEVGSTLSSISLLSGHTDKLLAQNRPEKAQQMVQKIYTDARQILESIDEIIWTINPGNDSLQRIILRLQEYAQPLMESKNIRLTFESDPALADLPVSMEMRRNLFLIAKEAINNLVKYSEATEAKVWLARQDKQLEVVVEDNGRGFDPQQMDHRTGQNSMQQRARAMSGSLLVNSAPNQGTALRLSVPIS